MGGFSAGRDVRNGTLNLNAVYGPKCTLRNKKSLLIDSLSGPGTSWAFFLKISFQLYISFICIHVELKYEAKSREGAWKTLFNDYNPLKLAPHETHVTYCFHGLDHRVFY